MFLVEVYNSEPVHSAETVGLYSLSMFLQPAKKINIQHGALPAIHSLFKTTYVASNIAPYLR